MRKLAPRIAAGALLASVFVVLAIGAFGSSALRYEVAEGGIACSFRALTGVMCPFCGMTHATVSLGLGNIGGAFSAHPVFPVVLGFTVWGCYRLVRGKPLSVGKYDLNASTVLVATAVVWVVNLVAHSA